MKRHNIIYWLFSLCAIVVSCAEDDGVSEMTTAKRYDLLLSVGHQHGMRMANDVVQTEGQKFRGLKSLLVIPFRTEGAVTKDDQPLVASLKGDDFNNKVTGNNFYYFTPCSLMNGTNRMLVYGQAALITGKGDDNVNGKLETTLVDRMMPSDITFKLKPIRNTTSVHPEAQTLANYLTLIAKTTGWSTTSDSQLKSLYLDFIHADVEGSGLMAGSAANVKAYVADLKKQLQEIGGDLSAAIIQKIDEEAQNLNIEGIKYPAPIGLPDGAAALRWTGNAFVVPTTTTTLDNINAIDRYTFPAELWYFVDSPICTSNDAVSKSVYENEGIGWNTLLSVNYRSGYVVTNKTEAVAVENPLQYAVARLQMKLNAITTSPLYDSNGDAVPYDDEHGFKLTGVIIGGQQTVGFDFKPLGVDARFIYDTQVGNHVNNAAITVNTLVLQSYDEEKVPIVLEFVNNTGKKFKGKDGVIYPGTKFYLIGEIDPAGKGEGIYANRVFTQDYTTEVTMTVASLAKAFCCMPDLLQPRLEIGVKVQTQWIQSTTTTVKL